MGLLSYYASVRMHACGLKTIFHAPMSYFDATPLGTYAFRESECCVSLDEFHRARAFCFRKRYGQYVYLAHVIRSSIHVDRIPV